MTSNYVELTYCGGYSVTSQASSYIMLLTASGWYCDREGLPEPTGLCQRGYYCPEGQVTDTPANYTCPEGHYCKTGYGDPAPCPSGKYQVWLFCTFL